MTQGLRPSQYITTFGPGALIETPFGPHILCSTDDVLHEIERRQISMEELAIRDIRLQRGLLNDAKIFKIPDESLSRFFYPTKKFPTWNLCVQHQGFNVIHKATDGCPECKSDKNKKESKKPKYAIRFLVACPQGHLDDVNWNNVVHFSYNKKVESNCPNRHFLWLGSGSSMNSVRIKCPLCSVEKKLGEIYSYKIKCWGKRPENMKSSQEACLNDQAIVVSRGSFQLRLPEVITSLTIPPLVSPIHRILQRDDIQRVVKDLRILGSLSNDKFIELIRSRVQEKTLPLKIAEQLNEAPWDEIENALISIDQASVQKSRADYLRQEHQSLSEVVDTGFPPYPHDNERRQDEPISFQVDATSIKKDVLGPSGKLTFRVMPIERLRVVIVQTGYRRVEYIGKNSVLSSIRGSRPNAPEEYWLPGVEQYGEGIYIDLNPTVKGQLNWYPGSEEARKWDETIPSSNDSNELIHWNALSVWWHSLSHRLINAMSIHSGYSSSAIRERVYLSHNGKEDCKGGILLYTTQPGGDGTMGGLTSLSANFESILDLALRGIDRCSNDPLCEHAEIDKVSKLGAACYSCEMVSETSCEHYNGYLHRGILLENLP